MTREMDGKRIELRRIKHPEKVKVERSRHRLLAIPLPP
jgi:hypothetical protein